MSRGLRRSSPREGRLFLFYIVTIVTIVPIALSFLEAADHSQRGTNRREDCQQRLDDEFC